jgi:acyl carrier protein
MTIDDVKEKLRRLVEENAGMPADLIRDDSTLSRDFAMDSLSFLSLQVAVEETFGVACAPEDLEKCDRFDTIAALILARLDRPAGASRRRSTLSAPRSTRSTGGGRAGRSAGTPVGATKKG